MPARRRFQRRLSLVLLAGILAACSSSASRDEEQIQYPADTGARYHPAFTYASPKAPADPKIKAPERTEPVRVLFAGDTHFQWGVETLQRSAGRMAPVAELVDVFHAADFRVLNLETSISDRGRPLRAQILYL